MAAASISLVATVRELDEDARAFLRSLAGLDSGPYSLQCILAVCGGAAVAREVKIAASAAGLYAEMVVVDSPDLAAARRAGVRVATGDWVSFPHAADLLDSGYLAAVSTVMVADSFASIAYVAERMAMGARRGRGRAASESIPLGEEWTVPADVTSTFYRIPERAAPPGASPATHVDVLLAGFLLGEPHQASRVTHIPSAVQLRRRLPASDPQTEFFRADAESYLALVRAHIRSISGAAAPLAARLAQELALLDVRRLLSFEYATVRRATVLGGAKGEEFRSALAGLLALIDDQALDEPVAKGGLDERVDVLTGLQRGRLASQERAHVVAGDVPLGLMEVRYSILGTLQDERVTVHGIPFVPSYEKVRTLEAFGQTTVAQRIVWVPATDGVVLTVDGQERALVLRNGSPLPARVSAASVVDALRRGAFRQGSASEGRCRISIDLLLRNSLRAFRAARRTWLSRAAMLRAVAHLPPYSTRFHDAWTFMDRADGGRDNAEHMYRWIRAEHPDINAWYVVRADAPDFSRLRGEGFRVVGYGSVVHQILLHNTRHYLSSHVGVDVTRPVFDRYLLRTPPWTFTFLQHGVIHNDLSIWLNNQRPRVFVTSTPSENQAIAGYGPYIFTDREVVLTGLPRFDRLRKIADRMPREDRRTIVIAPTWRNGLFEPGARAGMPRVPKEGFDDTLFIRSLVDTLGHAQLASLESEGYDIRFVPHPNLAPHFPYDKLPEYVTVSTYASTDVQELLGTAAVFLTDYSSVAFDAAFADVAVVYLHRDEGAIYGVDHTLFPGYFDFHRDGFGPVCSSVDEAMDAVAAAARGGEAPMYRERARAAFPNWDTANCQRVFDAIRSVTG